MNKVLITGAGTGFGHEVAMRMAEKGFDVIAAVEIYAQVQTLKRDAAARGVTLQVEKIDVANEGDRKKALAWNIEILVNNAGVLEGGSVLDIPESNIRREFEVNVIGPLLLTQGIAKQMVKRRKGRIVWVSSREGLNVNPFTGIYSASKHAVEAVAETMSLKLQEFGIEVATINPGPFLTGFNDRGFETWKSWEDDPAERLFDYSKLAFPRAQFDPEPVYATMTAVAAGEVDTYLSQPGTQVDARGNEAPHRGPLEQEDKRRPRHATGEPTEVLRDEARDACGDTSVVKRGGEIPSLIQAMKRSNIAVPTTYAWARPT